MKELVLIQEPVPEQIMVPLVWFWVCFKRSGANHLIAWHRAGSLVH